MKAIARVQNKSGTEDIEVGESGLLGIKILVGLQEFYISEENDMLRISSNGRSLVIEPGALNVIRLSEKQYQWR